MDAHPSALKPHDVCVGLQLVLTPSAPFREIAERTGLSLGEAHNSTKRLQASHLLLPHRREVNRRPFLDFLMHGVPYVYPGELGPETQGIPTGYSAPAFSGRILAHEAIVWPSLKGEVRGSALAPLCKKAPTFPETNPDLYRWLTVVDAMRVGRSRERDLSQRLLEEEILGWPRHAG